VESRAYSILEYKRCYYNINLYNISKSSYVRWFPPLSLSLVAIGFLRRLNSLDRTKYIITYFVKSVEAVEDSYLQFGSNFFASL